MDLALDSIEHPESYPLVSGAAVRVRERGGEPDYKRRLLLRQDLQRPARSVDRVGTFDLSVLGAPTGAQTARLAYLPTRSDSTIAGYPPAHTISDRERPAA